MENDEYTGTTMDFLKDVIASMAIQAQEATSEIRSLVDIVSNFSCAMVSMELDITSQALSDAENAVLALSELLLKSTFEIHSSTLESLQKLVPLVPDEKREEFEEIVAPAKATERKILTIENVKWLLGVIIPILFSLYLSYLPDKNAEEQAEMQLREIAVEQEENELRKEEIELLREFFDYVKESGISFQEQVGSVQEQIETIEKDIDVLDDTDLPDLETDDLPDQPPGQDGQN